MKLISEASREEAVEFFLSDEAYCNLPLPPYISFGRILNEIYNVISDKKHPLYGKRVKSVDAKAANMNHAIVCNKNSGFSWRKITLINPYYYVYCVIEITSDEIWPFIQEKLKSYLTNEKITPLNLPFIKTDSKQNGTAQIIRNWWSNFENGSIALSMEYNYLAKTDISNCYDSIYSHSLEWVFGSKEDAKKGKKNKVGGDLDTLIQRMNEGQTNGILTGSEICNLFAELVLGDVDLKLADRLNELGIDDYKILRYRDDYRIFSNNEVVCQIILKSLSEILQSYGMSLNAAKTSISDDIIISSVKSDKIDTIYNPIRTDISVQKMIFFVYTLSIKMNHPKSINKYLNDIIEYIKNNGADRKFNSYDAMCGIIVNLIVLNASVYQSAIGLLSYILHLSEPEFRIKTIRLMHSKLSKLPNTYYFNIWFQRLILPYIDELTDDIVSGIFKSDDKLCELINETCKKGEGHKVVKLWNFSFVENMGLSGPKLKDLISIMTEDKIVLQEKIQSLTPVLDDSEFDIFNAPNSD